MTDLQAPDGTKPSMGWIVLGVAIIGWALLADPLGIAGGAQGLGLRELAALVVGMALVSMQLWRGASAASASSCVIVWVWIGLLCGLADAGHWAILRTHDLLIVHQTHEFLWMIPTAYLVMFGALGAVCVIAARVVPHLVTLPVIVLVPTMIAAWSISRIYEWVDEYAGTALAAGVAVALGRAAAAHPERILKVARWSSAAITVVVLGVGGWTTVSKASDERAALAALPAAREGAPNVLLVVLDTVRADRFGFHGASRDTAPKMDAFSESAVIFDRAIATAPWTLTSHASIFTGRFPYEQNADWITALDNEHPTLAEVMGQDGYVTGGFVANLGYCAPEAGLSRGFAHYEDYATSATVAFCSTSLGREIIKKTLAPPYYTLLRNSAGEITDRFLRWQEQQSDRPFFAFLNYYDPHAIYIAPEPYDTKFGEPDPVLYAIQKRTSRWSDWTPEEAKIMVDAYDGCMAYMDAEIGRMLDELARRGVLDNTLVIITSDHGELLGEHNLQEHQNCLYDPLLHVPLVVRFPGVVPSGERIFKPVSLTDIPATILDVTGFQGNSPIPGHSLAPMWNGDPNSERSPAMSSVQPTIRQPAHWPSSQGAMSSLYVDDFHYIINWTTEKEELFNLREDPGELTNLIEAQPDQAAAMRAALKQARSR